jgi:hypothetical protein
VLGGRRRGRALEVALLREEAETPEPSAVAAAFLDALRELGVGGDAVIAIDDVQRLDPDSAHALAFAALGSPGWAPRAAPRSRPPGRRRAR